MGPWLTVGHPKGKRMTEVLALRGPVAAAAGGGGNHRSRGLLGSTVGETKSHTLSSLETKTPNMGFM